MRVYFGRINKTDGITDLVHDFPAVANKQFDRDNVAAKIEKIAMIGDGVFVLHVKGIEQDRIQKSLRMIFPQCGVVNMAEVIDSEDSEISLTRRGAVRNPCNIFGLKAREAMDHFGHWSFFKRPNAVAPALEKN